MSAVVAAVFRPLSRSGCELEFVIALAVLTAYLEQTTYSSVFVSCLQFVRDVGAPDRFSGIILGTQKIGMSLGHLFILLALRYQLGLWNHTRAFYACSALGRLFAASIFFTLGIFSHRLMAAQLVSSEGLITAMGIARCTQGFFGGMQVTFGLSQTSRLLTGEKRTLQNTRWFVGATLGMASGPLLVTLETKLSELLPHAKLGPEGMLYLSLAMPLVQFAALLNMKLSLDGVAAKAWSGSTSSDVARDVRPSADTNSQRADVVLLCISLEALRSFAMSSSESAMSILLKTRYHVNLQNVAELMAVTVASTLPVQATFERFRRLSSRAGWAQLTLLSALLGSLLACSPGGGAAALVASTALTYAPLALFSGLVLSMMQDHALPTGSLFDTSTITVVSIFFCDIGHALGSALTRWRVADGADQQAYAIPQFAVCVALLGVLGLTLQRAVSKD